jgi:hypothetical protein
MQKKTQRRTHAAARRVKSRKSTKPPVAAPENFATAPSSKDIGAARRRFVDDLLIRGEAAKCDKRGKLPLGATHRIKKQNPDGSVEVARVRFKTF